MKKSRLWIATAALFTMFTVAGCSSQNSAGNTQSSYTALMSAGKKAVKAKNYKKAQEKFAAAHKEKKTEESKAYAEQANELKKAQENINDYNYNTSLNQLTKAIGQKNGYSLMTSQAKQLYGTVDEVQNNLDNELNPLFQKAQAAFDAQDYAKAEDYATQVLSMPYLDGQYKDYYDSIRKNAETLLGKAKDKNNDDDVTTNKKDDSDKQSSSKSSSSDEDSNSSSSESSSESSQSSSTSSSDGLTVDGQALTARTIAQARAKLNDIGADTSNWSDQDVANFMQSASNNGHSTIDSYTQSDVENYNK